MSNPSTGYYIKNSNTLNYSDILNIFQKYESGNTDATNFFYLDTTTNKYIDLSSNFQPYTDEKAKVDATKFIVNTTDLNKIFKKK